MRDIVTGAFIMLTVLVMGILGLWAIIAVAGPPLVALFLSFPDIVQFALVIATSLTVIFAPVWPDIGKWARKARQS